MVRNLNISDFYDNITTWCDHYEHMEPKIHTSSLIKIEKTLNRLITKFYNSDDVNVIAAELRLTKMRPTSFNKKHNLL